jgi:hypothetical protein
MGCLTSTAVPCPYWYCIECKQLERDRLANGKGTAYLQRTSFPGIHNDDYNGVLTTSPLISEGCVTGVTGQIKVWDVNQVVDEVGTDDGSLVCLDLYRRRRDASGAVVRQRGREVDRSG